MDVPWWYFPFLSVTAATMVMQRCGDSIRAILKRRPDETFAEAWARGVAEREERLHAQNHMLGTPRTTVLASMLSMLLLLSWLLWWLEDQWFAYPLGTYYIVGCAVASRLNLAAGEHWAKLSWFDRLMCRMVHAWIWPIHALRKTGNAAVGRR